MALMRPSLSLYMGTIGIKFSDFQLIWGGFQIISSACHSTEAAATVIIASNGTITGHWNRARNPSGINHQTVANRANRGGTSAMHMRLEFRKATAILNVEAPV